MMIANPLSNRSIKRSRDDRDNRDRPYKKQKHAAVLEGPWFSSQNRCFEAAEGSDPFFIARFHLHGLQQYRGSYSFFPDAQSFVSAWISYTADDHDPLFICELIKSDRPCRFYIDAEQVFEKRPPEEFQTDWLLRIISTTKTCLLKLSSDLSPNEVDCVLATNDSRPCLKGNGYKLSFHLTWPRVSFDNNHIHMKAFVKRILIPSLDDTVRGAVDTSVYSKNRVMRLPFASKVPDRASCLMPWNVRAWKRHVLSEEKRTFFLSEALVYLGSDNDRHVRMPELPNAQVRKIPLQVQQEAPRLAPPQEQARSVHQQRKTIPADAMNRDRPLAKLLVPLLSQARANDRSTWTSVGFCLGHIFGHNDEGLELYRQFSARSVKFDERAQQDFITIYGQGNGQLGMGSLVRWAESDSSPGAVRTALATLQKGLQKDSKQDRVLSRNTIHCWTKTFSKKWTAKRSQKKPKAFKKARKQLINDIVKYMNRFVCKVVGMPGKPLYIQTENRHNHDGTFQTNHSMSVRKDMLEKFTTSAFTIPGQRVATPMTLWDSSSKARVLPGKIVFDPHPGIDAEADGNFNLYCGPAISRDDALASVPEGSIAEELAKSWLDHIRDIWCDGDADLFEYDLNWLAQIIQKPWQKTCVAIYLIGEQGAGKGLPLNQIRAILGSGFYETRDVDTVIGTYQHQSCKENILTFLDECTFSKDKKQQSRLKGLVTESKKDWSAKYINTITIDNYTNIIGASNAKKVVNLERSDRRNLIQHVNPKYAGKQTKECLAHVDTVLAVRPEHVAAFLYTRDISTFNSRNFPTSSSHVEHKIRCLEIIPSFWHEVLMTEAIPMPIPCLDIELDCNETNQVDKGRVFRAFKHFESSQRGNYHEVVSSMFWKTTKAMFEGTLRDGNEFAMISTQTTESRKAADGEYRRVRIWRSALPSVLDMRHLFAAYMKEPSWPWPQVQPME
jgi:hypothetical protein